MPPDRLALPGLPDVKEKSRSKKPVPANSAVAAAVGVATLHSFYEKNYRVDGAVAVPIEHAWSQVGIKSAPSWHQVEIVLSSCEKPATVQPLMTIMEWKDRSKFREKYITPLLEEDILVMTIPDKPTSSRQQYCLTEKGR
jgi:hypothetical protein